MRGSGKLGTCLALWAYTALAQNSPPSATVPATYKLQPGDELQVEVIDIPELNATVKIRPDGKVSLLLLNEVQAANRTVPELRDYLAESYAKFYRNPRVGISVKSFENRNVYVTGEVLRPGAIPLAPGMTAVQAIVQAGGLNQTSKTDEAVVIRQVEKGTPRTIKLRIAEVLQNGEADLPLQPGDVIYVPKSDIKVYVGGEVTKPGMLPMDGRITALSAVMNAGGFTNTASPKNAFLLRDNGDHKPQVMKLHLDEVMKGGADTVLYPYDVVFVPKSGIAKLDRTIEQYVRAVLPVTLTGGFSYLTGGAILP
jgi:protein involved in polysaccharide export with SLBB domain